MHHCLNVAAEGKGTPGCVLIRAAEPVEGSSLAPQCGRGPGRLCRSLRIDTTLSGASALDPSSPLQLREGWAPAGIGVTPRIGIRHAADRPLRFFDPGSRAVSRHPRT
jgi:DNA-3-methyladenine glycosylase